MISVKHPVRRLAILLRPRFVMSDLMALINCLEAANSVAGRGVFSWQISSEQGHPVVADNGLVLSALHSVEGLDPVDAVALFSGPDEALKGSGSISLYSGIPESLQAVPVAFFAPDSWRCEDLLPEAGTLGRDELISALIQPLLSAGQSQQLTDRLAQQGYMAELTDNRIHRALQLMRENLATPLDNRQLAAGACLSVRQLERLFRRYFDETPARYYANVRLQSARRMLRQQQGRVLDVALACGFASLPHFCRQYRLRFGVTPGQDR